MVFQGGGEGGCSSGIPLYRIHVLCTKWVSISNSNSGQQTCCIRTQRAYSTLSPFPLIRGWMAHTNTKLGKNTNNPEYGEESKWHEIKKKNTEEQYTTKHAFKIVGLLINLISALDREPITRHRISEAKIWNGCLVAWYSANKQDTVIHLSGMYS